WPVIWTGLIGSEGGAGTSGADSPWIAGLGPAAPSLVCAPCCPRPGRYQIRVAARATTMPVAARTDDVAHCHHHGRPALAATLSLSGAPGRGADGRAPPEALSPSRSG